MRAVLHGDVAAAACVLLAADEAARPRLIARLLAEADAADRYRVHTGQSHRIWGNGSLMDAAMARERVREPFLDDPGYLACMALVFEALLARRS